MSEKMDKKALKKKKKKKSMVMKSVILILTGCSGSMYFLSGEDSEKGSGAGKYTETGYGAESGWRRCYG